MTGGQTVKVKNKNRFGIVPDSLLENRDLSLPARAVAAWLVGRSDNFEIRTEALRRILGISENGWRTVRKELEGAGFWKSERNRDKRGIFFWIHTFEYMDGSSIPPEPMDGSAMHGKGQDITTEKYQEDLNHEKTTTETTVVVSGNDEIMKELVKAGFGTVSARELISKHNPEKIKKLVAYGKEKKAKNLAGFIRTGLEEDWKIEEKKVKNRFDEGIVNGNPGKISYLEKARQEQAILEKARQEAEASHGAESLRLSGDSLSP